MKSATSILLFAITAMFLSVTTAQALISIPPPIAVHTIHGANGSVDVGEFEISGAPEELPGIEGMGSEGGYFVDVLDASSLFGFAVSINSHVYPYTDREGWNAAFISAGEWDDGHAIGALSELLTTDIGGFFSLFGDDQYVNLYYNVEGDNIIDGSDTSQPFPSDPFEAEFFFSGGHIASDFVAFTSNGTIIDQSRGGLQPVPEPSTIFLFGTGIAGLFAHTLRKKLKNLA